jgi:hypothetical protein
LDLDHISAKQKKNNAKHGRVFRHPPSSSMFGSDATTQCINFFCGEMTFSPLENKQFLIDPTTDG